MNGRPLLADAIVMDSGESHASTSPRGCHPYGVSWQIIPSVLPALMEDPERAPRVAEAFLPMTRFDIDAILKA